VHLLRLGQQEAAARVDLRPLDHLAALILLAEQRRVDDVCAVARHDSRDRRGAGDGVLRILLCAPVPCLVKKENRQPKGGMGGRHAATTQGF